MFLGCMSKQKIVDASKHSVLDEHNMDTVFMAVILYQLKLLKCVIVAADHAFCCIYYHSIVLRTNYFLFVKFVCFIPVFLCLRQSFVLTSFLNVICRHSDCIIPMLFADTVIA